MLHTKFRGNRSTGSREEDFSMVFTIYGHKLRSSYPRRRHIKFGFDRASGFREEDV